MPTDNHDKQKLVTRTKTNLGRRLSAQIDTPGSYRDCHDFAWIY